MTSLSELRHRIAQHLTNPVVSLLSRTGLTPNMLTLLGFLGSLGGATAIATGHFLVGGLVVLFSSVFDLLDGPLARAKGQATPLGALLDSTLDRLSEIALFFGLLLFYTTRSLRGESLLVYLGLTGSLMVSYVRARAEGLGWKGETGLFTRAERIVAMVLGLLLNQVLIALWIVVAFTFLTVMQRLFYLWRQMQLETPHPPRKEE